MSVNRVCDVLDGHNALALCLKAFKVYDAIFWGAKYL